MHFGLNPMVWEILGDQGELKHPGKLHVSKFSQGHFGLRLWSISALRWIRQQAIWASGLSLAAYCLSWAKLLGTVFICVMKKQFKLAFKKQGCVLIHIY